MKKGFTLLEVLLAVAAIGILASIVIIAVNPGRQLANARNSRRQADIASIASAIYQYTVDHDGVYPPGINSSTQMLGTASNGCSILCGGVAAAASGAASSLTDSASTFSQGTFSNTTLSSKDSAVELSNPASNPSGDYSSGIKDAGPGTNNWVNLSWTPLFPLGPLPNNGQSESSYPTGNANMNGNVLLMHLDEASGATTFGDSSGKNNNGSCSGATCPLAGKNGQFNTALEFGNAGGTVDSFIRIPSSPSLQPGSGDFSISFWMDRLGQGTGYDPAIISSADWKIAADNGWELVVGGQGYTGKILLAFGDGTRVILITSNGTSPIGTYTYWTAVWDRTNNKLSFYKNGQLDTTESVQSIGFVNSNDPVSIGRGILSNGGYYDSGQIYADLDEIAVYNRALSASEVLANYERGAGELKFQARSCPDQTCSANPPFVGPDGTANSYYTQPSGLLAPPHNIQLANIAANEFFQYKSLFASALTGVSPALSAVGIGYSTIAVPTGGTAATTTANACLDLSASLQGYLPSIPNDPKFGSPDKSYYAVSEENGGGLTVEACGAENGQSIQTKI